MTNIESVIKELENHKYNVVRKTINKDNEKYDAIIIKNDNLKTEPQINMDDILTDNPTKSASEIAKIIVNIYRQHCRIDGSINDEFILENIHTALRKPEKDKTIKRNSKFKGIEEYLCIYSNMGKNRQMMLKIDNDMLKKNGISEEQAWIRAKKNNKDEATIISMKEIVTKMKIDTKDIDFDLFDVYMVTNKINRYGCVTILEEDFMKSNLPKKEQSKWQIVPLSVHEAVLIPKMLGTKTKAILELVKKVEKENTEEKDRLTDNTYTITI